MFAWLLDGKAQSIPDLNSRLSSFRRASLVCPARDFRIVWRMQPCGRDRESRPLRVPARAGTKPRIRSILPNREPITGLYLARGRRAHRRTGRSGGEPRPRSRGRPLRVRKRLWSATVDDKDVSRWFGGYLDAFAACGRGESDAVSLLAYYGVPLLLATDEAFLALTSEDRVVAAAQEQIDGMRAADYDHSDVLGSEVTVLNATSALYRGAFSRRRSDWAEISRLTVTYLVTDGTVGRRISALVVHAPD